MIDYVVEQNLKRRITERELNQRLFTLGGNGIKRRKISEPGFGSRRSSQLTATASTTKIWDLPPPMLGLKKHAPLHFRDSMKERKRQREKTKKRKNKKKKKKFHLQICPQPLLLIEFNKPNDKLTWEMWFADF